MIEQGRWLIKTSTDAGKAEFEDFYEMSVDALIDDYELKRHEIDSNVKAYVFLEYNGDVNKIIRLQAGDQFIVYGEGHYGCPINTSGMAVIVVKEADCEVGEQIHEWVVENSPYEIEFDEWDEFDRFGSPESVIEYEPMLNGLEPEEVVFVRQL